jgi:glycosyltransferase involved in cell wall biosynthesis
VELYKYRAAPDASGVSGFVYEFAYSWIRTAVLSIRVWRDGKFEVMQACNPPDTYWLLGRLWRMRGVKFVFDQHDLNPELFVSRFGHPDNAFKSLQYALLLWLERMAFHAADRVISTNESYRRVALERGGVSPEHVTVVRSGPDTTQMRPMRTGYDPSHGKHLLVYLGIMGPQDGVDAVLEVMADLVHQRGRTDVRAALLGFGDCLEDLKRQASSLGLDEHVEFTGRVGPEAIAAYLSVASVGLCPDRKTPLNDVSTMNKTMEYMAYAVPPVAFDLVETRVSAGDTGVFVADGDVRGFADAVEMLLDDSATRVRLSLAARARAVQHLDWRPQSERYVQVFDSLTGLPVPHDVAERLGSCGERNELPSGESVDKLRFPHTDGFTQGGLEEFVARRGPLHRSSHAE